MKKIILVVWLLLPAVALAYHFGPGQKSLERDEAHRLLLEADQFVSIKNWNQAVLRYEAALEALPEDSVEENRWVRLEMAKAQMLSKQLPEAHKSLALLVEELKEDESSDGELLADARSAHANSQYYMTWLMRLEGQPEDVWRPEIDAAEQTYRLLAQQHVDDGQEAKAETCKQDLEAAIKLARMDLSDLQGLPLPSQ